MNYLVCEFGEFDSDFEEPEFEGRRYHCDVPATKSVCIFVQIDMKAGVPAPGHGFWITAWFCDEH
jgi:hypothetical protein